jgi:hypothetical protein
LRSTLVWTIQKADEPFNKLRRLELSTISASSATKAINAARRRSCSVMPPQRQAAPTVPLHFKSSGLVWGQLGGGLSGADPPVSGSTATVPNASVAAIAA